MQELINQQFLSAVRSGDLDAVSNLVDYGGAEIDVTDENGLSAVHIAVYAGYKNIVNYLIVDCNFDYQNLRPYIGPMTLSGVSVSEITGDNRVQVADVIFLRGIAQKYVEDDTVKRRVDKDQMLELMVKSINYLERSQNQVDFIAQNPEKPQIDRKSFFQQEVTVWVSACAKSLVQNDKWIDTAQDAITFKALRSLGKYTDLVHANRGIHYHISIVDTADPKLVRIALPEIQAELLVVRDYVQAYLGGNPNPTYATAVVAIPALVNYYSDISHLNRILIYTKPIMDPDFDIGTRLGKESVLRAIEAAGEAITVHLSDVSKEMFNGIDIELLSSVRNDLDHINGDARKHKALAKESRAARLEELLEGRNKVAVDMLERIVKRDIPYIQAQTRSILQQYEGVLVLPDPHDNFDQYAQQMLFDERKVQAREEQCYKESWNNIKVVADSFQAVSILPASGFDGFAAFLSLCRLPREEPVSILCQLKAGVNNDRTLKQILFNNARQHLNANQMRQLEVLKFVLKTDENMHYLTHTNSRITEVRDFHSSIPRGETEYVFGSHTAKLQMDMCIKSMELGMINFNEHAQELYENRLFRTAYRAEHGADSLNEFDAFIAKARKFFAHIGNNAFHGENVDHGLIIREIIPLATQNYQKVEAVYQTLSTQAVVFLETAPNWDNNAAFQPLLIESPLGYDPDLHEVASLAIVQYGSENGIRKLRDVGSDYAKCKSFQDTKHGFGKEVSVHLADSMGSSISVNTALFGGALMKVMEIKSAAKYLLTHYVPVLPAIQLYFNDTMVENSVYENGNAISIGLHFLGGTMVTYGLLCSTSVANNIKYLIIPAVSTTTYGAKQYMYDYRSTLLNFLDEQQNELLKFIGYIGIDITINLLMSVPFGMTIGFSYKLLYYPMTQGVATGTLTYYSTTVSDSENNYGDSIANTLTSIAGTYFAYKTYHIPTPAEKIISTAYVIQMLSCIYFFSKAASNTGIKIGNPASGL